MGCGNVGTDSPLHAMVLNGKAIGYYHPEKMLYTSSWGWLMEVVEKIEQSGVNIIMGRMFCEIRYTDPLNAKKHFEIKIVSGVKINSVVGAITEFIKWHNEYLNPNK